MLNFYYLFLFFIMNMQADADIMKHNKLKIADSHERRA